MKILELIGVKKDERNLLTLELSKSNQNHIGTMHAAAEFLLAETASGVYLQEQFPELKDEVIPLLRESQIKYKKTAVGTITASVYLSDEELQRFQNQFFRKKRATIKVNVDLIDEAGDVVIQAIFTWFVQKK